MKVGKNLAALVCAMAYAQEPSPTGAVLQNLGEPMAPVAHCSEESLVSAGLSCSEDAPCPVYLELTAAQSAGDRFFAAGNLHTSEATLSTILLSSLDAGRTWVEPYERIPAAGFEAIQFVDGQHGWISGQVLAPIPRDPFLLVTTDGGKLWRRQNVFDDARPGTLQRFFFSDSTNGLLLWDRGRAGGDRYELYASPDGGSSWTIKETASRPPPIKSLPDSELRVRVDAATKAYLLERRAGERWARVAAFAVNIGACR